MKTKMRITNFVLGLAMLTGANRAVAQTTAFTYNGRLVTNGAPANGTYDVSFAVYDANQAGNLVAGPVVASVGVTNGLFTARLDFGAGAFTGPARWLDLSVRPTGSGGYTPLTPRQEFTSSPYAIRAASATTAQDVGTGAVVKSLNTLKDNVALAAGSNVTITPSGNTLTIAAAGPGGNSIWALNGTSAFYNSGNVGIGTGSPGARLEVVSSGGDLFHLKGYEPFVTLYDTNHGNARTTIQSVNGGLNLFTDAYLSGGDPYGYLRLDTSGNVGIGSAQPVGKLEVVAQDALRLVGYQPFLTLLDDNAGYARGRIQSVQGGLSLFAENYLNGANPFAYFTLQNSGNVGIGSAQPVGKLEVVAQDALRLIGYQPFLTLLDNNAGYARSRIQGVNGDMIFESEGYVNGSSPNGYMILNGQGNVSVASLTIRGGADVAEPFALKEEQLEPGSVVVIDDQQIGRLKCSDHAYDTHVAGIVSGAKGINPGLSLYQEGAMEGGRNVALTGRVYVKADASQVPIKPGDLLTSSDVPGRAMKVSDPARAQGAILGKAMGRLEKGSGLVLVLVTLQ